MNLLLIREIFIEIALKLKDDLVSFSRLIRACKIMRNYTQNQSFWKQFMIAKCGIINNEPIDGDWKSYFIEFHFFGREKNVQKPLFIPFRFNAIENRTFTQPTIEKIIQKPTTAQPNLQALDLPLGRHCRMVTFIDPQTQRKHICQYGGVSKIVSNIMTVIEPVSRKWIFEFRQHGIPPLQRHGFACTSQNLMFIFGGNSVYATEVAEKNNDLWVIDPSIWTFRKVANQNGQIPSARSDFGFVSIGTKIYLFGGSENSPKPMNDLYELNTENMCWKRIDNESSNPKPGPRSALSLIAVGFKLFVFGGGIWNGNTSTWDECYNDFWMFDTKQTQKGWTKFSLNVDGSCPPEESLYEDSFVFRNTIFYCSCPQGNLDPEQKIMTVKIWTFDTVQNVWKGQKDLILPHKNGNWKRGSILSNMHQFRTLLLYGMDSVELANAHFIRQVAISDKQ